MTSEQEKNEMNQATLTVSQDKIARYDEIRNEASNLFSSFGKVACPALKNQYVSFTAEGFNHLVYRIKKQERHKGVQIMRFELLTKAKELLSKTTTVQEYEEYFKEIQVMSHKKQVKKNVLLRDWGFIGIIGNFRIKVVVRQSGDGEKKFMSVIPAWSTQYYRDIKIVRNVKGTVAET
jgi:hypothetical protein